MSLRQAMLTCAVLFTASCGGGGSGDGSCFLDSDCPGGERCRAEMCVPDDLVPMDAGQGTRDTGSSPDTGQDTSAPPDSGAPVDTGDGLDSAVPVDAGGSQDAGPCPNVIGNYVTVGADAGFACGGANGTAATLEPGEEACTFTATLGTLAVSGTVDMEGNLTASGMLSSLPINCTGVRDDGGTLRFDCVIGDSFMCALRLDPAGGQ